MGNLKLIFPKILLLIMFTACAQNAPEVLESKINPNEKINSSKLTGNLNLTSGEVRSLEDAQKTTVLYFISESCTTCIAETKLLAQQLREKGLPQNIQIYSVLIGSTLPDTLEWIQNYNVPWEVAFDEKLILYKSYFQFLVTPSIVIFNTHLQKVTQHQGPFSQAQIEQETGPWQYSK